MKFKSNFFFNYIKEAPLALAIERTLECHIFSNQKFVPPVLDLGCGEGLFAWILFKDAIETGIDLNAREIEAAKLYGIHRELIQCPADQIPKPSGYYHTIFSNSVLEHIKDIESVLREAGRLLSGQGHFYITVPTHYFDQYSFMNLALTCLGFKNTAVRFRNFYNRFWKHYHYHSVQEWAELFNRAGFNVIKIIEYCPKQIALLDDLLTWFALPSFLIKKLFNRWFLIQKWRSWNARLYSKFFSIDFQVKPDLKTGGIVFFDLVKKET